MPVDWAFAESLRMGGTDGQQIAAEDAWRQEATVRAILADLANNPGLILADAVGMGKTYVALGVAASVLQATRSTRRPVVIMMPPGLADKWRNEWKQFKALCCCSPR